MTTYFRDFSDADGISDFTELAHVSGNAAPEWAIQNTDEVIATSSSSHLETLGWNDVDGDANRATVEVVGMYKLPATSTTNRVFSVRVSSDSSRTAYSVRLRNADIYVYRSTGSTATQLAGDTTLSLTTGNWYWIRFQFSGINYKVKVWADGDSEPTTGGAGDGWNVSNTDDTYDTAGSVGLLKGNNTISHVWSMFGVGTNGDTAPTSAPATGVTGTGSLTTGATTSSGSGTLIHKGTGALSLAATTLSGSGTKTGSTVTLSAATVTDITTTTATPRVTLDFA